MWIDFQKFSPPHSIRNYVRIHQQIPHALVWKISKEAKMIKYFLKVCGFRKLLSVFSEENWRKGSFKS